MEHRSRDIGTLETAGAEGDVSKTTPAVLCEVAAERERQDRKWGEQNHPDGTAAVFALDRDMWTELVEDNAAYGQSEWAPILMEEVAEALAEVDPAKLRRELVQVAAVAVSWIEAIDRRALARERT
jgi:hypothetical protein